ncbi:pyridoxamine phosphate oxidase [Lophium mytilinum]|uniref:Pyridoxamine phosphate oxidase n=1 Tax=Lophium mytilinum TaxID=390894 RepID=A0A6A6QVX4_9PEZI|nr:pyridoxamine phosphate oxidase [Lophium mytilinum]
MVKFYPSINSDHAEFMLKQPLFYVASAPYAGTHVNLSPKGQPSRSFAVRGENSMAYVDATGSGCETISHVYENGRVTVMFCSFGVSPKIMRLFCRGTVIELGDKKFEPLAAKMGHSVGLPGARAIILLDVYKLQTSCGFGVPLIGNSKNATTPWESETEDDGQNTHDEEKNMGSNEKRALLGYQKNSNFQSLDGLPGLRTARRARGQWILLEDTKAHARRLMRQWDAIIAGSLLTALVIAVLSSSGILVVEVRV